MSGLVLSDPKTATSQDAINAALANDVVSQEFNNLRSSSTGIRESFTKPSTHSGTVYVGTSNLILTGANSTLTIDRGTPPPQFTGGSASDLNNYLAQNPTGADPYTTVVVGGSSTITFAADTVDPSFGYDVVAGSGNNVITFKNAGPNTFNSTDGNDLVKSGGGFDSLNGGTGHDTIYAGGNSFVTAGSAGDKIFSSTLPGGSDTIQAGAGSDTITLQAGNNSVIGSTGDTKLQAGTGNDTFDGSAATGNESILGGVGNLTATLSNVGNDTIFGQSGHDINVTLQGESLSAGAITSNTDGSTTINFTATGQTIIVKNVNITFDGGVKQHF